MIVFIYIYTCIDSYLCIFVLHWYIVYFSLFLVVTVGIDTKHIDLFRHDRSIFSSRMTDIMSHC
jgi:hypothetical protein